MPGVAVKKLRIQILEPKEKWKNLSNKEQRWSSSQKKVWFSKVLLTADQITNAVQVSDIRSLEPKTRLPRDKIKVKRFRIEHSPKMSLPHPNLAALGLLPTHIVWMALPLLPWGCVDLRRPRRQNGLVVRWGLSSAADSAGPPSSGLGAGGTVRQRSAPPPNPFLQGLSP